MVLFVIFIWKITKSILINKQILEKIHKKLDFFRGLVYLFIICWLLIWWIQVSDRIASERNSITSKTEKMKNELLFFKEKFISGEGIPKGRDLLFSAGFQILKKSHDHVQDRYSSERVPVEFRQKSWNSIGTLSIEDRLWHVVALSKSGIQLLCLLLHYYCLFIYFW